MRDLKLLQEQIDNCRGTARSNLTMIRIYLAQGDRLESIKQCAVEGRNAILKAKELELELEHEVNEITAVIAA